eukprot:scaffold128753_cov60-Phaeocystis_antarctica.AAC.1
MARQVQKPPDRALAPDPLTQRLLGGASGASAGRLPHSTAPFRRCSCSGQQAHFPSETTVKVVPCLFSPPLASTTALYAHPPAGRHLALTATMLGGEGGDRGVRRGAVHAVYGRACRGHHH